MTVNDGCTIIQSAVRCGTYESAYLNYSHTFINDCKYDDGIKIDEQFLISLPKRVAMEYSNLSLMKELMFISKQKLQGKCLNNAIFK